MRWWCWMPLLFVNRGKQAGGDGLHSVTQGSVWVWVRWVIDQRLGQVFLPPVWDEEGSLGQQAGGFCTIQERLQERLNFWNTSRMCCAIPSVRHLVAPKHDAKVETTCTSELEH